MARQRRAPATTQLLGGDAAVARRDTCRYEKEGGICTNRPNRAHKTVNSSVQRILGVVRRAN